MLSRGACVTVSSVGSRKLLFFIFFSAAEIRKDVSSQFHNTLYTGDVVERVKVLKAVGQGVLLIWIFLTLS